jgi:uncharacterized membrane protein YphA (DoxX/SURF4 family)
METEPAGKGRKIAIWILKVFLGILFLTIGSAKLTGTLETTWLFAAIGWGQWFRYFTGILDLVGAVLLFVPRWTCLGALVLVCTVGTAALIYLFLLHHNPMVPLAFTLLAATLAWLTRPHRASNSSQVNS